MFILKKFCFFSFLILVLVPEDICSYVPQATPLDLPKPMSQFLTLIFFVSDLDDKVKKDESFFVIWQLGFAGA